MANQSRSSRSQVSFNGGEWSPLIHDRIDFSKFFNACREVLNWFLLPYGGMVRRAGTQHIEDSKADTKIRLIPFVFSTTTTYALELGNQYMRFYNAGARVESGGSPVEVSTPWATADLFGIKYAQDDDIMYLVHPDHPRQKLTRLTATSFSLAAVEDLTPPLLDENETATTITPSGTTGSITLAASAAIFDANHVGSYWQLKQVRNANFVELTGAGTSSTLNVEGDWRFEVAVGSASTIDAVVEQLSQDATQWETIASVSSDNSDLTSIVRTGSQPEDRAMRVRVTAHSGTARAYLENLDAFNKGLVKITAFTDTQNVNATVENDLLNTNATPYWSEGAFSDHRGYPNSVCIYESRLWYGGTSYRPQDFFGSKVNDYEDFPVGTLDTDRVKYRLGGVTQNAIKWMVGQEDLIIGTGGEEFRIGTGDSFQPLTPSIIPRIRSQSRNGSADIQAELVGDVIMFVQKGARKVREFVYSFENNKYRSPDLTELSEHITSGGICCMAYQRDPYSILWAITGDGDLIGMAYEREQDLVGWFKYQTLGTFESVCVLPGSDQDEVWVSVKRTVNSVEKRFVERINPTVWTDPEDAFYVDCGITYDGAATSTITGLTHLVGETVQVLGDGAYLGEFTVDGSGEVDLGSLSASVIQCGLKFTSRYKPMKFDNDNVVGNSQGQSKQLHKIDILLKDTMALRVYDDDGKERDVKWRDFIDNTSTAIPLFTGVKEAMVNGYPKNDPFFTLVQDRPFPATVVSVVTRYEVTEPI